MSWYLGLLTTSILYSYKRGIPIYLILNFGCIVKIFRLLFPKIGLFGTLLELFLSSNSPIFWKVSPEMTQIGHWHSKVTPILNMKYFGSGKKSLRFFAKTNLKIGLS